MTEDEKAQAVLDMLTARLCRRCGKKMRIVNFIDTRKPDAVEVVRCLCVPCAVFDIWIGC